MHGLSYLHKEIEANVSWSCSTAGSQSSSVRTQDLLQPLQKHLTPTANKGRNLSPNGFPPSAVGNTQNNTSDYSCSQQIPYAVVNGTSLESALNHHSKYKNENASFLPKSRAAHTTPLNQYVIIMMPFIYMILLSSSNYLLRYFYQNVSNLKTLAKRGFRDG